MATLSLYEQCEKLARELDATEARLLAGGQVNEHKMFRTVERYNKLTALYERIHGPGETLEEALGPYGSEWQREQQERGC